MANVLLARRLGPDGYGFVFAIVSVNAAAVLVAEWSTDQLIIRRVSHDGLAAAAGELAAAARLRLFLAPIVGAFLMGGFLLSRSNVSTGELLAGALVAASSVFSYVSLVPAALLALGETARFVALTQVNGLLWSLGAILVAIAHPTVVTAALAFVAAGVATAATYVAVGRRHSVHVQPLSYGETGATGPTLLRQLAPGAWAQVSLLAPWRLIPALVGALVPPVSAGLVLASLRYWEQLSVPAVAIAHVEARSVATRGATQVEQVLRRILIAACGMTLLGLPISLLYARVILGDEFEAIHTKIVGGVGMAFVAGLGQALVPVLLASGLVEDARRVGTGLLSLLALLVPMLVLLEGAGAALAGITVIMGAGLLGMLAIGLRAVRLPTTVLLIASTGMLACAIVAAL